MEAIKNENTERPPPKNIAAHFFVTDTQLA